MLILHYEGRYLIWSSIVDAPITYSMTYEEIKDYLISLYKDATDVIEERLDRAKKYGSSMKKPTSLEKVISFNRAGKNETCLNMLDI